MTVIYSRLPFAVSLFQLVSFFWTRRFIFFVIILCSVISVPVPVVADREIEAGVEVEAGEETTGVPKQVQTKEAEAEAEAQTAIVEPATTARVQAAALTLTSTVAAPVPPNDRDVAMTEDHTAAHHTKPRDEGVTPHLLHAHLRVARPGLIRRHRLVIASGQEPTPHRHPGLQRVVVQSAMIPRPKATEVEGKSQDQDHDQASDRDLIDY